MCTSWNRTLNAASTLVCYPLALGFQVISGMATPSQLIARLGYPTFLQFDKVVNQIYIETKKEDSLKYR